MKQQFNEIEVNGITYIPKGSGSNPATSENYPIMMVRTYSAGVFYGEMKSRKGKEVVLLNARRVWWWEGAATISQLAQSGTTNPAECKFPEPVSEITLTEAIEIIPVQKEALISLNAVTIWKI